MSVLPDDSNGQGTIFTVCQDLWQKLKVPFNTICVQREMAGHGICETRESTSLGLFQVDTPSNITWGRCRWIVFYVEPVSVGIHVVIGLIESSIDVSSPLLIDPNNQH